VTALPAIQVRPQAQPAGQAETPSIPPHWISENELHFVARSTLFDLYRDLSAEGRAAQHPDGTRYFDRDHQRIAKHIAKEPGVVDDAWRDASPDRQRQALDWCRALELIEASAARRVAAGMGQQAAYCEACKNVGAEVLGRMLPIPTFYERRRRYLQSGRRRSSMLDARGQKGFRSVGFDRQAWAFFESLWLTTQRRTVRDCYEQTAAKARQMGWAWPGDYSTVRKRIAKVWPPQKADYFRWGERIWRMKHAPKIVRDKRDLPANAYWQSDHLRLDHWSRIGRRRARLWVTVFLDRASNLPVGWCLTACPSQDSISLAFRRAVKDYGACLELSLDEGEDYRSRPIGNKKGWIDREWAGGVFDQLGITVHWCEPYSPEAKGQVESFARVVHDWYDKLFASYCGGAPKARPEAVEKWCEEHFNELLTPAEEEKRFAEFIKAFIERPSDADGVKPLSPRQRFEKDRIARRTCPDQVLNTLLLKLTGPRKVTSKGVLCNGLRYTDDGGRLF